MDSMTIHAPKAVVSISNTISLNIWDIRHGVHDEVLVGFNNENPQWCMIYDTDNEGCYFVYEGTTYGLLDAMRVNI